MAPSMSWLALDRFKLPGMEAILSAALPYPMMAMYVAPCWWAMPNSTFGNLKKSCDEMKYDAEIDKSIFDPNIPDGYSMLIDPANIARKAELLMLVIWLFVATIIMYKRFKKRKVFNIVDNLRK